MFADLNVNRLKFEWIQEWIQKNIIFESESIQIVSGRYQCTTNFGRHIKVHYLYLVLS